MFGSLGKPNQVQRLLCEDVVGWIPFVSIPQSRALFTNEESTTLLVLRLSPSCYSWYSLYLRKYWVMRQSRLSLTLILWQTFFSSTHHSFQEKLYRQFSGHCYSLITQTLHLPIQRDTQIMQYELSIKAYSSTTFCPSYDKWYLVDKDRPASKSSKCPLKHEIEECNLPWIFNFR